jgi:hypothetical protein
MPRPILRLASALFVIAGSAWAAGDRMHDDGTAEARAEFDRLRPATQLFYEADRITRVYGRAFSAGDSPADSAERFRAAHAGIFGVDPDRLLPGNHFIGRHTQPLVYRPDSRDYQFTLVYYAQYEASLPVFRAELRLLVRNQPGYPLVLAASTLRDLGGAAIDPSDLPADSFARGQERLVAEWPQLANFTAPELIVWAGIDDMDVTPRLAEMFYAESDPRSATYEKWLFLTDALTGEVLYREDQVVHVDIVGSVRGVATEGIKADLCADESPRSMPYARVRVASDEAFSDADGIFLVPHDGSDPVEVISEIRGPWFRIFNDAGDESTITYTVNPGDQVEFLHNESNAEFPLAEVNAYVHANLVRDLALRFNPDYPTIGTQEEFPIQVNGPTHCNAFYTGSGIRLLSAGSGCANSAFSVVVYHEYGHHLVQSGGSAQGAYGEGMSDTVAMVISDEPKVGIGFEENCRQGIRSADNNKRYPCDGEIHDCGTLLSGCVWDTRNELKETNPDDYLDILARLTINSILLHASAIVNPTLTIDFLTLDDDNADISDGTPHYDQIATGFERHNMDAPPISPLRFEFPSGLPRVVEPRQPTTIRVVVSGITEEPKPGTGRLFYATGDAFETVAMQEVEANVYDAVLPALECAQDVRFYFRAETTARHKVVNPPDAPDQTYRVYSALSVTPILSDDFETDKGWTVRNDDRLISGAWERGVPAGNGSRLDPPTDFDGSGQCYITDNRDGNSDVDEGATVLISPRLALKGADAVVHYARWYGNAIGNGSYDDVFTVSVSNDNGANWVVVETVGPKGLEVEGRWFTNEFRVGRYVTPTDLVRVSFTAADLGETSVVEAGVDAFLVERLDCGADRRIKRQAGAVGASAGADE